MDPFPNNQIPSTLINQNLVKYAQAVYPAPINIGVPGFNGLDSTTSIWRQDQASIRFDQQFSAKDTVFYPLHGHEPTFHRFGRIYRVRQ